MKLSKNILPKNVIEKLRKSNEIGKFIKTPELVDKIIGGGLEEEWEYASVINELKDKNNALENEHKLLLDLINDSPNPMSYKSLDGLYIIVNKAFCEIVGKQEVEIIGKTSYQLFKSYKAEKYDEFDKKLLNKEFSKFEFEDCLEVNGEKKYFKVDKIPFKDTKGKIVGFIQNMSDITEYKKNIELLEEIKKNTEKTNRKFIHDLGNKITSLGALEMLKKYITFKDSSIEELYNQLISDGAAIKKYFDDMKAELKNKKNQIKIETFSFDKELNLIVSRFQNLTTKKIIISKNVGAEGSINLKTNFSALISSIENLVNNSIQANNDIEDIIINIDLNESDKKLKFSIKNYGAMPKEVIENFGVYGVTHGKPNGTGIGLNSVKENIEKIGGRLELPKVSKNHTEITFEIPIEI